MKIARSVLYIIRFGMNLQSDADLREVLDELRALDLLCHFLPAHQRSAQHTFTQWS